jgi:hypothetical protein
MMISSALLSRILLSVSLCSVITYLRIFILFYFHSAQDLVVNSQLEGLIPHLVSDLKNQDLVKIPDMEEVKNIVFDMKQSSSAGPDGFNGKFSHFCWDIIANDLICMLLFLLSFQVLLYLSLGLVL